MSNPYSQLNTMRLCKQLLTIPFFYVFMACLSIFIGTRHYQEIEGEAFYRNHMCLLLRTATLDHNELWANLPVIVNECSIRSELPIEPFDNADETKFFVLPRKHNDNCTVISLGIGKDVEAERNLKSAAPYCTLHGADPVEEVNKDIYPEVGTFHHVAVGGSNGTMEALVLEDSYVTKQVEYVDIATFMRRYVKSKVIDNIFIDVEGAEYAILPYLHREGQLALDGVRMCQINMEVHRPNEEQKKIFHQFFHRMLQKNEFAPLIASTIIGHVRLYMINHSDGVCYEKFLGELRE